MALRALLVWQETPAVRTCGCKGENASCKGGGGNHPTAPKLELQKPKQDSDGLSYRSLTLSGCRWADDRMVCKWRGGFWLLFLFVCFVSSYLVSNSACWFHSGEFWWILGSCKERKYRDQTYEISKVVSLPHWGDLRLLRGGKKM